MVIRNLKDARPKKDAVGRSRDESQALKRIHYGKRWIDDRRSERGSRIQHDVFWHVEGLEATVLGVSGVRDDRIRIDAVEARVVDNAEFH